ncbi:MAG: ABC transporter ATP-binding protein [Mariprofundaceae bacterium]|nr:ABC transporter ATP-binding protein [Mariprofundaceae bacterium]
MDTSASIIVATFSLGKHVPSPEGELHILTDINLTIHAGEAVCVVGASGSGKSTLLGLLAGLDQPSMGSVCLGGQDIGKMDEDGRAGIRGDMLGFVFQSFQLLPTFNALENIMLPMELAGFEGIEDRAAQLLHRVGLGHRGHHLPAQLSGGEQQRVAIARAFATEPALLLADEPTGNLDSKTGRQIIDMLFDLNAESGTTLILVTHDESLASRCNRRIHLQDGRIVNQGSKQRTG